MPKKRSKKEIKKVNLFSNVLPLFLLPERCQIIFLNKIPPSKELIGIRLKQPRNRFKIPTLEMILIIICSLSLLE